jgi:hypothetical protein
MSSYELQVGDSGAFLHCQSEDKLDIIGSEGFILYSEANFYGLISDGNSSCIISVRS